MDDVQLWKRGVMHLEDLAANLSVETGQQLTVLLARYRRVKETSAAAVAEVDAASICCDCKGQCCLNGKYRMSALDVLARMAAEIPTAADFSRKPVCPYGTGAGCLMEPGLRPADCVLFICDAIDRKLTPQGRLLLAEQEQIMRQCIHDVSCLTGEELGTPLLLWAAKKIQHSDC